MKRIILILLAALLYLTGCSAEENGETVPSVLFLRFPRLEQRENGGSRPSVLHITPVENSLPGQRHNLRALIYADIVHFKFCREAFLVCPFAAAPGSAPGKIHQQMHALVKRPYV